MPWQGFDVADAPAPSAPPSGFVDRFSDDFTATVWSQLGRVSQTVAETAAYDETIDRVYGITGRKVPNPALIADGLAKQKAASDLRDAWEQARGHDSSVGEFPNIDARAEQMARERVQRSAAAAEASVGAGGLGAFAGGTAASMLHPAQIATLPFGAASQSASWATRILSEAAVNAGISAVTQVPISLESAAWKERLGLQSSLGTEVTEAAVGGAIFGGGLKAVSEAWRGITSLRPVRTPGGFADALQRAGWSPNAAAGIAGNASHESGGRSSAAEINFGAVGDGGTSFGALQWHGPRRDALVSFADARGADWRDPATQIAFLGQEIDQFPGLRERLNTARSPREAAEIFLREFERPADLNQPGRGDVAEELARRGDAMPREVRDAVRAVERAALDEGHAIGPREASVVHQRNVRAAEAAIVDGEMIEPAALVDETPVIQAEAVPAQIAEAASPQVESGPRVDSPAPNTEQPATEPPLLQQSSDLARAEQLPAFAAQITSQPQPQRTGAGTASALRSEVLRSAGESAPSRSSPAVAASPRRRVGAPSTDVQAAISERPMAPLSAITPLPSGASRGSLLITDRAPTRPHRAAESPPIATRPELDRAREDVEIASSPAAIDAETQAARRAVADAITDTPGAADQQLELDDGRVISLSDLDAELARLERQEQAADVIHAACIIGVPLA